MEDCKIYKVNCNKRNEYAFSSNVSKFVLYIAAPNDYEINLKWLDNYLKKTASDQVSVVDISLYEGSLENIRSLTQLYNNYSFIHYSSFFMELNSDIEEEFNRYESYNIYMDYQFKPKGAAFVITGEELHRQIQNLNTALLKYNDIKVKYMLFANDKYKEIFINKLNLDFKKSVIFNWDNGDVFKNNIKLDWYIKPNEEPGKLIMHAYISEIFIGMWYNQNNQVHLHFWRKDGEYLKESIFEGTIENFVEAYKKIPNKNSLLNKIKNLFK